MYPKIVNHIQCSLSIHKNKKKKLNIIRIIPTTLKLVFAILVLLLTIELVQIFLKMVMH